MQGNGRQASACAKLEALVNYGIHVAKRDDQFEWDDDKAAVNLVKHEVSFEQARLVFNDSFPLDIEDRTLDEHRLNIVGISDGSVLFVAYTYRDDRIRLISARKATRHERKKYHERA